MGSKGCFHYGYDFDIVRISDAPGGGLTVRSQTELTRSVPFKYISALGRHDGLTVFLADSFRLLMFES
jgi:hypothetical protein